jgi:lipoyl(octanoyl) transferase
LPDFQNISSKNSSQLKLLDLGLIDYQEAWDLQTKIHNQLILQKKENPEAFTHHTLILCEHPHVFTLGKSGVESNLLQPLDKMDAIDAKFYKINRGGDITYHGPGQLVAYPILDLEKIHTDVHWFVRNLEQTIIEVVSEYGINADRIKGLTGVWIDKDGLLPRKICAIGVHLSRWVSLHGLAFNVNTNLDYFKYIIPCGIHPDEKKVTSLSIESKQTVSMEDVKQKFISYFISNFDLKIIK